MRRFKYAYNSLVYHGEDIAQSIERVSRFEYDARARSIPRGR